MQFDLLEIHLSILVNNMEESCLSRIVYPSGHTGRLYDILMTGIMFMTMHEISHM